MTENGDQPPAESSPAAPTAPQTQRYRPRHRASHRPRGRRSRPSPTPPSGAAAEPSAPTTSGQQTPRPTPPPTRQASTSQPKPTLTQARERLRRIIRSLQDVLADLQSVLELVDKAEAQKQADEDQLRHLEQALNELEGRHPQRGPFRSHPR